MSRLPISENSEVLTIRISAKLKEKLNQLAERKRYGNSSSEVVRYLIKYHSKI